MNISLTPELEQFIKTEVGSGLYQSASEVIRAGLRKLQKENESYLQGQPRTLEELEARLLEGIERLDRGEGIDGEEMFARIFKKIKAKTAHG